MTTADAPVRPRPLAAGAGAAPMGAPPRRSRTTEAAPARAATGADPVAA